MSLSREAGRAMRKFADAQSDRVAEMPNLKGMFLTVTSITATDVFVEWRGSNYPVAKVLPHYTPGVGDRVLVLYVDDQLTIVG